MNTKNRNGLADWYKGGNREQAKGQYYEEISGHAWWVTRYLQYNVPLKKYITYKDKSDW